MTIEWFADLVIVIFGLVATVAVLVFLVIGIFAFVKVKSVMDTAQKISGDVRDISSCIKEEVVKPIAQMAAVIQGVRQATSMFGPKKRKED